MTSAPKAVDVARSATWTLRSLQEKVVHMHEYRRFVQDELDTRGWRQSDLVRRSGLSRQLVSNILRDDREHLGQMPDAATLDGLATGFGVPVDLVRAAAARSLVDYTDDGTALTITLSEVSTDALLYEIRRRIDRADQPPTSDTPAQAEDAEDQAREEQKNLAGGDAAERARAAARGAARRTFDGLASKSSPTEHRGD